MSHVVMRSPSHLVRLHFEVSAVLKTLISAHTVVVITTHNQPKYQECSNRLLHTASVSWKPKANAVLSSSVQHSRTHCYHAKVNRFSQSATAAEISPAFLDSCRNAGQRARINSERVLLKRMPAPCSHFRAESLTIRHTGYRKECRWPRCCSCARRGRAKIPTEERRRASGSTPPGRGLRAGG